jgi:hypothetical protein
MRGSWTVPRVLNRSPAGSASTWIGAGAPGPQGAFIQLGSTETESSVGRLHRARQTRYEAFWSDVRHGLHPRKLFRVNPGDDLSATLMSVGKRWRLAIVDRTSRAAARLFTTEEAGASFNHADWAQENVTSGEHVPDPYPHLTAVGFRQLAINSAPPTTAELSALWMSVGGSSVAPSPLHADSFTLARAPKVSAAGAQYLRIASPEDAAANAFFGQFARWTASHRYSQIAPASAKFAAVLRHNIDALAHARWPASAEGPVRSLIKDTRSLLQRVGLPPPGSRGALAAWRSALTHETEAEGASRAEDVVRRILNVPFVPAD